MKYQILILLSTLSGSIARANVKYDLNDAPALFEDYVQKFNKSYMSEKERQAHFEAFKKSLELYNEYNKRFEFALFFGESTDFTELDWELLTPNNEPAIKTKLPAKYHKPYFKKEEYPELFPTLIQIFDKKYKDEEEKQMRYKYFVHNTDKLNEFNRVLSYKSTIFNIIDESFDFTEEELERHRRGLNKLKNLSKTVLLPSLPILYRKKIYNIDEAPKLFDKYLKKFEIKIPIDMTKESEKEKRIIIFKDNLKLINELNENFVAPFKVTASVFFTEDERRQRREKIKLKGLPQDSVGYNDDDNDSFGPDKYILPEKIPSAESDSKDIGYHNNDIPPVEIPKLPVSAPRPAENLSETGHLKQKSHGQQALTLKKLKKWAKEVLKWTTIKPLKKPSKQWSSDLKGMDDWMEKQMAELKKQFDEFTKKHNKHYKDDSDREKHFKAFCEFIINMNWLNENFSDVFNVNKFADATKDELLDFVQLRSSKNNLKHP